MACSTARNRYLLRYGEAGLPGCPPNAGPWHQVLVIPACDEPPALVGRLRRLPAGTGRSLVIVLLNRPDSDHDPRRNAPLRSALQQLTAAGTGPAGTPPVVPLNRHTDLYWHDIERLMGPTPAARGVGLVRKTGCDIALKWMEQGAIHGDWLHTTDADALLPEDYFRRLECARGVAAVFPFCHTPGPDAACNLATALYELRLHHYVLGLQYAGSPYAWHSLGSCLAFTALAYAQVRGFPRRAGAEDFYLLNKLTKVGAVERATGECILLDSRHSRRVPFGTGPAVAEICAAAQPRELPLFYHPACFEALRALLAALPALPGQSPAALPGLLAARGLAAPLCRASAHLLERMGLEGALAHCQRHGKTTVQFQRHFHQWFDAFRTLKFIHGLRDSGWPSLPLAALQTLTPELWPAADVHPREIEALRLGARRYWGWITRGDQAGW
jgi:hypothetical protein